MEKLLIKGSFNFNKNGGATSNIKVNDYDYFGFNDKMKQKIDQKIIDFIFDYIAEDNTTLNVDKSSYLYSDIKKRMVLM